ncbi:hypothetical protein [Methylobacterium sp. B4]|uniref:hypothetical protein n=1 Tax=Methylobacterium sp. B4 TaxID=1938755 RepID=UPI000D771718|nr:hypothetical protein [Methylobacterium sp. B4]PXW65869.1 hypothetical protein BY998_102196 [Methylobacterium sp. B4]
MEPLVVDDANSLAIQRLLIRYLAEAPPYIVGHIAGATVIVEPSRHRTGLPDDAEARRYIITHCKEQWSIVVRSVWRNRQLLAPSATHTVIEQYDHLDSRCDEEAKYAVNKWLRSLGGI